MMRALAVVAMVATALFFAVPARAEQCGSQAGGALCPNCLCCSQFGWCGSTSDYCGSGCQSQCSGSCGSTPNPPSSGGVASIIPESLFNQMLLHRNDAACPANGFYTYAGFIAAANAFPGFGTTGAPDVQKRELAPGGVPGADVARDDGRVGDGARRALRLGLLLQGGAGRRVGAGLLRAQRPVAVRRGEEVLRPRAHPDILQLQLRARRPGHRRRHPRQPGPGGHRPHRVVRDRRLVLDDAAVAQAVVPRRHDGAVDALRG
ncbi:uncharacterized protein LOC100274400 precursor [Zea mays]|uniref:chitinase n=1 Tax=Zea mays TaxID=4577 RepID=A0A804PW49_MAIZE|nr:uncharacterized protein LOC100274400 precursor [Zea mays]|eukprot:NP_001142232.2 uncharacterized protein LOC100274400 precursor [Zea mays]